MRRPAIRGVRAVVVAFGVVAVATSTSAVANTSRAPHPWVADVAAGASTTVQVKSFLYLDAESSGIRKVAAVRGVFGGFSIAADATDGHRGTVAVPALAPCRYAGPCTGVSIPTYTATGRDVTPTVTRFGVPPGTYRLLALGPPGGVVRLSFDERVVSRPVGWSRARPVLTSNLTNNYPLPPDLQFSFYGDRAAPESESRTVAVALVDVDAADARNVQYTYCLRNGELPVVPVPAYGAACSGDNDSIASGAGIVTAGGCEQVAGVCVPLTPTTSAVHLSVAVGKVFARSPRVGATTDTRGTQAHTGVRVYSIDFPTR